MNALADAFGYANASQFNLLFPKVGQHGQAAIDLLKSEQGKPYPQGTDSVTPEQLAWLREIHAVRQANCAIALLRMQDVKAVRQLLEKSEYPTAHFRDRPIGVHGGRS